MDVCIKNINNESWLMFKSESAKHGMKMGNFFNNIVKEHTLRCKGNNWNEVLYGKKILKGLLTKSDLKEIRPEFRKNMKLRLK